MSQTLTPLDTALAQLRLRRFDPQHPDAMFSFRLSELAALGVGQGRSWEMRTAAWLRNAGYRKFTSTICYGEVGNWWRIPSGWDALSDVEKEDRILDAIKKLRASRETP